MTLSKNHHLNLKNGKFHKEGTTKEDLDRLFQNLASDSSRQRLVLYFHGGMVSQKGAYKAAETTLYPLFRDAAQAYPVFFIWQSGFLETLGNNLGDIVKEVIFKRLKVLLCQFAEGLLGKEEGRRSGFVELQTERQIKRELRQPRAGNEPFAYLDSQTLLNAKLLPHEEDYLTEKLEEDDKLLDEIKAIAASLDDSAQIDTQEVARGGRAQLSRRTLMSSEALANIARQQPDPGARGFATEAWLVKAAISVLKRVIKRFAGKRDHGFHATIVEEILREFYLANAGKVMWDLMKGDTADAFKNDSALYGGTAFLRGLKTHLQAGHNPQITLIGHSTGAIYISHFIRNAAKMLPAEAQFNVIFLAPASDFNLFADTLKYCGDRIANLRLFGLQDQLEATDSLISNVPVYPRSVLYLVSGILEDQPDKPLLGMERYYSGKAPYDSDLAIDFSRRYLTQNNRLVWSVADEMDGCRCAAASHQTIDDNDKITLNSLKHIITKGF